jgi:NADH-quinone oxidoreductase subunit J
MLQYLHFFLSLQLILCSCLVFLSHNPVNSVLFLILSFVNAASILLLFNVDFLGILFIIIYVGAIAVLFLFVVMMLNVKIYVLNSFYSLLFYLISCILLFVFIYMNINLTFFDLSLEPTRAFNYNFDNLSNIDIFGQSLYNNYLSCFLLAGLVLLVAMVGAIILTLNFSSSRKNELVERQLSRSDNFLTFYK